MTEWIRHEDRYYILATSARIDDRTRVIKDGDSFAIFDRHGDIHPVGLGEQGLYHAGTRYLSRLELTLGGARPLLLSSTVREDNGLVAVDLANPDLPDGADGVLPANTIHVFRSAFLWRGVCYQRLRVHNYALGPAPVRLHLAFAADFADVFEVRGLARPGRGELSAPVVGEDAVVLAYRGLDGVERRTRIAATPPARLDLDGIELAATIPPNGEATWCVTIACEADGSRPAPAAWAEALRAAGAARAAARAGAATIDSSNEQFNDWVNRSVADLDMMLTETPDGFYPYAGVPWYSTVFGRDGIITAYQTLWIQPAIARGVLAHLAARQATAIVPDRDAEPGKILHEARQGEMAALGEVPFGLYYGSVDATPLFVVLAGAYYARTGDRAFLEQLWPHVARALEWIDRFGDRDGDGFVEYERRAAGGLANQGWKDSHDAVFHADGTLATGPIALAEVQGYVYAARRAAAAMARALGHGDLAARVDRDARRLRHRFEEAFWCPELGTYALALDGAKRPCRVRASNAGHVLWSGLASPERAARVAETLLGPDCYSGWGIRTLAASERRYNPMSYHNGSVWPHDNALVAAGLVRYGHRDGALRVLAGLFDASLFLDLHRLPELFCGFERRPGEGPTLYPVACAPQAWAVGAVFLLLGVALGLSIDGAERRVLFRNPALPPFLEELRIRDFAVAPGATIDVVLHRHPEDVGITVTRRAPGVEVVVIK